MTTPDTFSGEESSASFEPKKSASVEEIEADITRTRSDPLRCARTSRS